MKPIALLIHTHPDAVAKYADAFGLDVSRVKRIYAGEFSEAYAERKGLARKCPTLDRLIERYAPGTAPDTPVILMGFSAGCWAVRYYLRDPDARRRCAAVMLVDGLHASADNAEGLAGPTVYAKEALAGRKVFVLTHSQIVPPYESTRATANHLLARLGLKRDDTRSSVHEQGLHVIAADGVDGPAHSRQQMIVGVEAARLWVAPVVDVVRDTTPAPPAWGDDTRPNGVGELAVEWCRGQMMRENPPSAGTKAAWFAKCERNGLIGFLGSKFSGNHCAAAQCAAAFACAKPDETLPHRHRAGAKELMADAAESGAWVSRERVLAGWRPRAGDLAIYDRSQPGRPETSWWGHVDRVSDVGVADYENIGANEGPGGAWRVQRTEYDHPRLLGFVSYPQPEQEQEQPPVDEPAAPEITDADRRHVETLVTLTMEQAEAEWWATARS